MKKVVQFFQALLLTGAFSFISYQTSAKVISRGPASTTTQVAKTETAIKAKKKIADVVEKIRQDDEGLTVLFKNNEGSYYLRNETVEFDKARAKLEKSLADKKPVQVMVEPTELNILEVK